MTAPTPREDWPTTCERCGALVAGDGQDRHAGWHGRLDEAVSRLQLQATAAQRSLDRRREELMTLANTILKVQERIEANGKECAKQEAKLRADLNQERARITTVAQASLKHAQGLTNTASALATIKDVLGSLRAVVVRLDSQGRQR